MRRTNIPVALFLVAFAITTKADFSLSDPARAISLCDIALGPKAYHNASLTTRADLYIYSGHLMHLNGIECGPRSDAWATLEFEPSFVPTDAARQFLESIGEVKEQGEYKKVEVRTTGRIEDLGRSCYGPRFVFYAARIELLSEIQIGRIEDGLK